MAKRKFSKVDAEAAVSKLLTDCFNKTGDHQVAVEFIISQYVHLFGEVKRDEQLNQIVGIMNQVKEL